MKATIRSYNLNDPVSIEDAATMTSIAIFFASFEDRDAFFAKLPKSVRARSNHCWSNNVTDGKYGLVWFAEATSNDSFRAPEVTLYVSSAQTKVTGSANEGGVARRERFIRAIREHLTIVDDLNK